ncbi:unnamed protein product [Lathyrus oleraceus]
MELIFILLFCSTFFSHFTSAATPKLNTQEVKALKEIGNKIGKKDWDFGVDPCSGKGKWNVSESENWKGFESSVICDCSFKNNSSCHVVSMSLKEQNLSGILSPEFSKLRHLKILDLSRNIITGSIPRQWTTMNLVELSLMGNRLSGPFPKVLTNITTLKNMSIEGNLFSGFIPTEIGNLINLEKLILQSNAFTGALPSALSKLTKLNDVRLSDNNFFGKIPDFISKWKVIEKLHIQGCSLEGPIPSSISALSKLSDLRITDLRGSRSSTFPPLNNMKSMKTLVLRRCAIKGEIPEYIGVMEKLKILDLSFNSLSGKIPDSFAELDKVDYMYLTSNNLSGTIPGWVLENNKNIDISNNNFEWENLSPTECQRGSINLVESYSLLSSKKSNIHSCLKKNFPCSTDKPRRYSMRINCGGSEANVSGSIYEADIERKGASMLFITNGWALSSTGGFMDNDIDSDPYTVTNTSKLNVSMINSKLYTTARVSPLSLTYYGLCMINGIYTVKLHFAEIIFINDRSFNSLGKRIFDVYIQGNLVLRDFDIEREAGGTGKPIVKKFNATVTQNTLKIQFYWAGKGTTGIPTRGVYGPSVSAISVDPNFKPPLEHDDNNNNRTYVILLTVGIVSGVLVVVLIMLAIMRRKGLLGGKDPVYKELQGIDLQTGLFTLKQIKVATKNFDAENKLGEGGFGSVYKGLLSDGTVIAVKQLSSKSKQGNREFVNEIGMLSGLQHPNLVKLHGCCVEGNQLILIYEYMENNCLSRILFGKGSDRKTKLDWLTRKKICLGIAKALAYLHEESRIKIIHRDIKASNVLLDKDFNAKISDFGLAKLIEDDKTHVSTRIAGTIGYMAPEYAMRGYLTDKADVYSFGVVALETISGKSNTNYRPDDEFFYLLDWAYVLQERGSLLELVDPDMGSDYSSEEAIVMLNVALLCTNASPTLRPTMCQVVSMLEGWTDIQDLLSDPGYSAAGSSSKHKSIRSHFWENPSRSQSMSIPTIYTDSSGSHVETEESKSLVKINSVGSDK